MVPQRQHPLAGRGKGGCHAVAAEDEREGRRGQGVTAALGADGRWLLTLLHLPPLPPRTPPGP